ncbi:cysteine hydrolase family protein [Vogesella indigofera]|uniref:cysteine hydrolase family protein n=1 Tax=Vogesella indigofera TaxID=45465 RepID=UPI00234F3905|nr:cysteine hydrolase family protein [Vogesella indigofera]MDC7702406.1 cysteine hydrolase family protein [Vogesella indigofera]
MSATALLVIDFQYGLIELEPRATRGAETLANLNRLIDHARDCGHRVVFIQHHAADLPRGSEEWQLHPGLQRLPGDPVIEKTACDSFLDTSLRQYLDSEEIENLWVGGYASDFCVDTTVRRAASLGYAVTVVADAHTCKDRPHASGETLVAHLNWLWANMDVPGNAIRVLPLAALQSGDDAT